MGVFFIQRFFLVCCIFGCIMFTKAFSNFHERDSHSFFREEVYLEKIEEQEFEINPPVYSKSGSDSISLIIFGKVFLPRNVPVTGSGSKAGISSKEEDKSKKKNKFNIKYSDKLKTNNSLY